MPLGKTVADKFCNLPNDDAVESKIAAYTIAAFSSGRSADMLFRSGSGRINIDDPIRNRVGIISELVVYQFIAARLPD